MLVVLPTGGGKTVISGTMMGGMVRRNINPWFMVHRKELLAQTSLTLKATGLEHSFIARGQRFHSNSPAQLVGIQYAARRLATLDEPGAMLVDEAHHAVAGDHVRLLDHWPDMLTVGLTATPQRLDGKGLSDRFDQMVLGPSPRELREMGFLSPFKYFAPGKPDLSSVRKVAGDWNRGQLADVMGKADLIGDVVDHYLEHAHPHQGIVFAVDRNHSRMIARAFQLRGIAAEHIDGSMTDLERNRIVTNFRLGNIRILVNVDLFGEGFDVPGIVYVGLCRPTKSLILFLQQCGRGLRIFDGKDYAVICDHAGNVFEHGLPDDDRLWSLEGHAKAKGAQGTLSIHTCPQCYQVTFSQLRLCPCGYEFPIAARSVAWAAGELFELTASEAKEQQRLDRAERRKKEERECKTYEDFYRLALSRGSESPANWARNKMHLRKGKRPGGRFWNAKGGRGR